jgi:hypothetical protein
VFLLTERGGGSSRSRVRDLLGKTETERRLRSLCSSRGTNEGIERK